MGVQRMIMLLFARPYTSAKYWGVASAQVAKKPDRKSGTVNRPANAFGIQHATAHRFL
jgi:hypothetical protein